MDIRKESLSALKICRFCLTQDETLSSLYQRERMPKNSVTLPLKILSSVSVEVFPSDKMPSYICNRCKVFMDMTYEYKQICRHADEKILQFVQNGTSLTPVPWAPSLLKMFHSDDKPSQRGIIKTVVDSGATVQVTTQDSNSDDDDDENVYNIKMGDGSDDGSKNSNVKVIPATNKQTKKIKKGKGFTTVTKLTRHVRAHASERAYPCKYCDKSFLKSHHYTRHLRIKHRETIRSCRGPFGETDQYRCEQCEDTFATQDELIYHSAIHATQNLTCPLCQEKFDDVDAVTAHIKSHVNGTEFMCDLCELVFTSKEKLDNHITVAHDDELRNSEELGQDESSMEMDAEDEDDNTINVKEEDDHMVVEIKKPIEFMITDSPQGELEGKNDNTNSEESETETTYTELSTVDTLAMARKEAPKPTPVIMPPKPRPDVTKPNEKTENQTASILRKAEEVKRKVEKPQPLEFTDKKEKVINKPEGSNTAGASDKSLRLLEKELQELKRTNTRNEAVKTPAKPMETLRNRRPQLHTSTPKLRTAAEDKKSQLSNKSPAPERKMPERRVVTKENKEPKETKETKANNNAKEEKEPKEKETPKNVVKNGTSEKSVSEEGVRRSTRPSKIKDYAKMIRDRSQDSDEVEEDSDEYEEYKESEKSFEARPKQRRSSIKATPKAAARKRGRPRKDTAVPAKLKKEESNEEDGKSGNAESDNETKPKESTSTADKDDSKKATAGGVKLEASKTPEQKIQSGGILVSPTGQTLKKIPIKALPPGVKPLPLPVNARPMGSGEVCEMQIGKKVVKVQKIVMTKAEVEAMAKKGLVEMKDGTMVLKQGIKLPTSDPTALKNSLVGEEAVKESPTKKDKGTPTRCELDV